jgi:hypothetical protein
MIRPFPATIPSLWCERKEKNIMSRKSYQTGRENRKENLPLSNPSGIWGGESKCP